MQNKMMYGIRLESTKKISYVIEYGMAHPLIDGGIVIGNHVFLSGNVSRTLDGLVDIVRKIMTERTLPKKRRAR